MRAGITIGQLSRLVIIETAPDESGKKPVARRDGPAKSSYRKGRFGAAA
jgi:hypothetical protein